MRTSGKTLEKAAQESLVNDLVLTVAIVTGLSGPSGGAPVRRPWALTSALVALLRKEALQEAGVPEGIGQNVVWNPGVLPLRQALCLEMGPQG